MINERTSAQANTPTSANMQYGYPTSKKTTKKDVYYQIYLLGPFDFMNIPPIQNPNDVYSYYPHSLYQPFGTFDEHNQWGSNDTSAGVPPPGPLQYHPQMYTPTGLDISRSPFDYPPQPHVYPHYHPGFTPSTFPGAPSTGTSAFDMSWNPHTLSIQQQMHTATQQQIPPIGGNNSTANKKPSVYDDYPSTNAGVSDMLAQQMNSVNLGNNYDNGTIDHTKNFHVLSSKEQQQYQSNSTNLSLSRPSGPKSYASVVSSDTINSFSNKSTPSSSNLTTRSNDSTNSQHQRNSTTGNNSRSANGSFPNWTNNNNNSSERSEKKTSSSRSNQESHHQYNPKDFNSNTKGARFFVIKSVRQKYS
jgi:hypothetical protein